MQCLDKGALHKTQAGFTWLMCIYTLNEIVHSSASFMACVEECISERESRRFEEELSTKVKLGIYKVFGMIVEFK